MSYAGELTRLEIGDRYTILEFCTFNLGTIKEEGVSRVGSDNWFMAYVHIAHDVLVANHTVLANNATLAGHVHVGDWAVIGGISGVHQFVRIGKLSIIGGCSKVVQDIPPYSTCDGHPAKIYGINSIGLKRSKVPADAINQLRTSFKILFHSGLVLKNGITKVEKEIELVEEVKYLLNFLQNSERGICRGDK